MKNKKMYIQFLEEKKSTNIRVTRQAKIAFYFGAFVILLQKTKNDSIYKRMSYHLELYKKFKRQLLKKYGSRVKQKART
jgi:hypothetical protein